MLDYTYYEARQRIELWHQRFAVNSVTTSPPSHCGGYKIRTCESFDLWVSKPAHSATMLTLQAPYTILNHYRDAGYPTLSYDFIWSLYSDGLKNIRQLSLRIIGLRASSLRMMFERDMGIEPISLVWKTSIIAVILISLVGDTRLELVTSRSQTARATNCANLRGCYDFPLSRSYRIPLNSLRRVVV